MTLTMTQVASNPMSGTEGNPLEAERDRQDRALVAQCLSEDQAVRERAQKELFNRFNPGIIYLAFRRLGSLAEAEDCAVEALRDVLVQLQRFQWRSNLDTWVYAVARHWIGKYARRPRLATTEAAPDELSDAGLVPAVARSPAAILEAKRRWLALVAEIYRLPPRYRDALHFHFVDGMSLQETADVMGTTLGAVKQLISRGRKALAGRLGRGRPNA